MLIKKTTIERFLTTNQINSLRVLQCTQTFQIAGQSLHAIYHQRFRTR